MAVTLNKPMRIPQMKREDYSGEYIVLKTVAFPVNAKPKPRSRADFDKAVLDQAGLVDLIENNAPEGTLRWNFSLGTDKDTQHILSEGDLFRVVYFGTKEVYSISA